MLAYWLTLHRWIGLFSCFGLILWGLSGLTHPIMTHLQPAPVAFQAPSQQFVLEKAMPITDILRQHAIAKIHHISLATVDSVHYYRISERPDTAGRFFNVFTGEERVDGDRDLAQALAVHFTGRPAQQIVSAEWITAFDEDYLPVNRLLPVWRVEFAGNDHLRAYIDTEQIRLSTLIDQQRAWLTQAFRFGHNWSFLDTHSTLQVYAAGLALMLIIGSGITGIFLFARMHNAKKRLLHKPIQKWHRRIGISIALATIIFAASGLFHLLISHQQERIQLNQAEVLDTHTLDPNAFSGLATSAVQKLDLMVFQQQAYWQAVHATASKNKLPMAQVAAIEHEKHLQDPHPDHHNTTQADQESTSLPWHSASAPQTVVSPEQLATQMACSRASIRPCKAKQATRVERFGNEYGFIFKRLPVYKVVLDSPQPATVFVELPTATISAYIRSIDGLEGFVFAYLHKWNLPLFNKDLRDLIVSLLALLNVVLGLLGLLLFFNKPQKHPSK